MNPEQTILVNRLKEVGLDTRRFLKLNEKKAAYETEWEQNLYTIDELEDTPCIGVCGKDGLVLIDTDRIEMETAIRDCTPATFEVESPRRKLRHFYLLIEGGKVENKTLHLKGEKKGCGEIRAQNYYLVAPGSEIKYKDLRTGEEKTGRYTIAQDRPIAKMQYADFMKTIEPYLGKDTSQKITFQQMREGVDEGTRHPQGIKYATFLVGVQQFDRATAQHAMREWNKLNRPPMNDEDLIRMVENAIEYVAGNPRKQEPETPEEDWFVLDNHGHTHFQPVRFAKFLLETYHFKTMRDDKTMYVYNTNTGTYTPTGAGIIHGEMSRYLDEKTRKHYYADIEFYIQGVTFIDRPQLNMKIACLNGLLDVKDRALSPFTPDEFILNQIPVKYDPKAECPNIDKAVVQIVGETQKCTLYEGVGYSLYKAMPIHKAFLFIGSGANGKSTLLEVLKAFLGEENVSNIPLQAICEDRFAAAELYGKLANICADLPDKRLMQTGKFKLATGGDTLRGERKFHDGFSYKNHAKMWFSCNKVPETYDDTEAYFRRWNLINCPNKFEGTNCDKNILTTLTTSQELSGLLNQSINALKDLLDRADFCQNETTTQIRKNYMRGSNSCRAFIEEALQPSDQVTDQMTNSTLYEHYQNFCRTNKLQPNTKRQLTINMEQYMPTARPISLQVAVGGKKTIVRGWRYLAAVLDTLDTSILKSNYPKREEIYLDREVSNASNSAGQTAFAVHRGGTVCQSCPRIFASPRDLEIHVAACHPAIAPGGE